MNSFSSFDGTRIAYGTEGEGEPVVLVHGFAANANLNWVQAGVVDALVAAGRGAVFLDCRGHGASDKPHDPAAYGDDAMVRDVIALLDHLGLGDIDLVGYSMGSAISIRVALREPRVRSVVLGGVGADVVRIGRPAASAGIVAGLEAEDPASVSDPTGQLFRAFSQVTGADRRALAAVARAGMSDADPSDIRVPTLVLGGEADALLGSHADLASQIPGARCVIVGGDHLTAVIEPAFRQAIVDFLADVAVTSA